MRHLVVGEAPARDASKKHLDIVLALRALRRTPAGGAVRLGRDLSFLHREEPGLFRFVERAVHVNLLGEWPGNRGLRKGSHFPIDLARPSAAALLDRIVDEGRSELRHVLLAGMRVARAFGYGPKSYDFLFPVEVMGGVTFTVVPHPSGVCRWWNSGYNARQAKAFLERISDE